MMILKASALKGTNVAQWYGNCCGLAHESLSFWNFYAQYLYLKDLLESIKHNFKSICIPQHKWNQNSKVEHMWSGIYRWSIILADTNFFQQSLSVAEFRGRNNRPSAKHFFIKLLMNFSWIFDEFWNLCKHLLAL